jgi:flavin-dependent dehydrogenase
MLDTRFVPISETGHQNYRLIDGSRVAIIGGGPAGSFFSYFLLDLAKRADIDLEVDVYEAKDFSKFGPMGCNYCGGIVSESLVQLMASEGINIPPEVVQRGLGAYVFHTDVGSARIDTPTSEKRIASMYRGAGPLGTKDVKWASFDGFLQELTVKSGVHIIHEWVSSISFDKTGRPVVKTRGGSSKTYDLIAMAVGVNSPLLKEIDKLDFGYHRPESTKTSISEFYMGQDLVIKYFGDAMHIFLLDIPNLEFAALIPKGDFVTLALLGKQIDKSLFRSFLDQPEVKKCFPPDWDLSVHHPCQCFPFINVSSAIKPFADRVVLVGDCAASKLYKNGIGSAYETAKAAATTAILEGISSEHFRKYYLPVCKSIEGDNTLGRRIFSITRYIQRNSALKHGVLYMVNKEKQKEGDMREMSSVLWDIFTGSANYRDIFKRIMNPLFIVTFIRETILGMFVSTKLKKKEYDITIKTDTLGKLYQDGEIIINQGEMGDCMYVIQSGSVEVIHVDGDRETILAKLYEGDFFGEMALFDKEVRSSTVRAFGEVRVITIDKKTVLTRIQEDPSMAFRMLERMSRRIRSLDERMSGV